MNPQSPDHCCDDCDFYEVAEEFIIDEDDHDVTEAPQISSGGDVTEHSDSQRLHHCPKQEDDLQVSQGPSSDIHCPKQEEDLQVSKGPSSHIHCPKQEDDLQVSKGPSSDILTSQRQEEEHGDQKSFVEDMKETSTLSQSPQDQQQQQSPPVKICSNPHLKEEQEEVGKKMEKDTEHPTVDHEGKTLQQVDDAGNSHFINSMTSTVEEQGTIPPILSSVEEKQQCDPRNLVEEIMDASIPSQNPQDQQTPGVGKMMEENIEHPTVDHEGKALQKFDDAGNSHFTNSITATVEEQGTIPHILCSPEEKQQSDPRNLVEEIKDASIPSQNTQDQQQQKPTEVGKMMEEDIEHPTADDEGKSPQQVDDAGNSHSTNSITLTVEEQRTIPPLLCSVKEKQQSDPRNMVEEIKDASIPSQNPQDQQQQKPSEVGKTMEEDIENPTVDHEGKTLQEVDDAGNSHFINSITSTVEEQGTIPPVLCSVEEKQKCDPRNLVDEIKDASIPSQNPEDQQQQKPSEVGKMMEEDIEHPTADDEGKALQQVDDAGYSHFTNGITSIVEERGTIPRILCSPEEEQQSDPKNLLEEIKEGSIPSQNPTVDHEGKALQEVDESGNSRFTNSITSTVEEQGTIPPILCSPEEEQQNDLKNVVEEIKEGSIPSQNPTVDHEGKALQEADDSGSSHFTDRITSSVEEQGTIPPILCSPEKQQQSEPKNLVEEIKEGSIPSRNPQDQQQQQAPPVEPLCSDHPHLQENLGKIMAEDLLEHQTANHEGKPSEEAGTAPDFHSSNDIVSTEALRPPNSEAEEENSAEKVIPSENDDKGAIGSSDNRNPDRFFCATKTLLSVVVSTFALIMVGKLCRRRERQR